MTLIVVDASTVAAWVLPSQSSKAAEMLLEEARQHRFVAPHVFPIEVLSLLLAAERIGGWTVDHTGAALEQIESLDIQMVRMDAQDELSAVLETARRWRLSIYDSFYLRLAQTDDATLASRDKAMLFAAQRAGVPVLDVNP